MGKSGGSKAQQHKPSSAKRKADTHFTTIAVAAAISSALAATILPCWLSNPLQPPPERREGAVAGQGDGSAGARTIAEPARPPKDRRLVHAVQQGNAELVRALLKSGASPQARESTGLTGLHRAVAAGSVGVVRVLIEFNASLEALDAHNHATPLDFAADTFSPEASKEHLDRQLEIARLLVEAGAKVEAATLGRLLRKPLLAAFLFDRAPRAALYSGRSAASWLRSLAERCSFADEREDEVEKATAASLLEAFMSGDPGLESFASGALWSFAAAAVGRRSWRHAALACEAAAAAIDAPNASAADSWIEAQQLAILAWQAAGELEGILRARAAYTAVVHRVPPHDCRGGSDSTGGSGVGAVPVCRSEAIGLTDFGQAWTPGLIGHETTARAKGAAAARGFSTRRHRLRHDAEQLEYLLGAVGNGSLRQSGLTEAMLRATLHSHERLLDALPREEATAPRARAGESLDEWLSRRQAEAHTIGAVVLSPAQFGEIKHWHNRLAHVHDAQLPPGETVLGATSRALAEAQATYGSASPSVAVVDGLLSAAALEAALEFAMRSTVWWDSKAGYLGTYARAEGGTFSGGELAHFQLIEPTVAELRRAMPRVLCSHRLTATWMYKYDDEMQAGINIHADEAAVNLNIWLTPDEALSAADSAEGGLVVYTEKPPASWTGAQRNHGGDNEAARRRLLEESGFRNVTVPYRQNRLVVFESDLFHRSGRVAFKPGYRNRRINWTLLFGRRGDRCVLPRSRAASSP